MSVIYANASYVHGAFMLTPKPEAIDKIISEFATFSKHVEANEPGTISYNVNRAKPLDMEGNETGGPETIIVAMIFKDQAAMQAHRESPEQLKFAEKMKTFKDDLQAPPELRTLTPAGGFVMKN